VANCEKNASYYLSTPLKKLFENIGSYLLTNTIFVPLRSRWTVALSEQLSFHLILFSINSGWTGRRKRMVLVAKETGSGHRGKKQVGDSRWEDRSKTIEDMGNKERSSRGDHGK
jgi:hypothetical protein